jgi:hypothetical protein
MQLLAWYLFIAAHLGLGVFAVGLIRLRRWREYPIFLAYVGCELASFLIVYVLDHLLLRSIVSTAAYQWTLLVSDMVCTALEVGVLYELADRLILSRSTVGRTLRPLLRWSGAILLLIAAAVSALLAHPGLQRAENAFEALNFASHLIVIGILFVLLAFSQALQVPWRSLAVGVAMGFGIDAGIEMLSSAGVAALGVNSLILMDVFRMSALLICVLVWFAYVLLPHRSTAFSTITLGQSEMEFWDQELQRMVRR